VRSGELSRLQRRAGIKITPESFYPLNGRNASYEKSEISTIDGVGHNVMLG